METIISFVKNNVYEEIKGLPEQDEFHLGDGALNDGRGVLVTPPIKNLVVNLA